MGVGVWVGWSGMDLGWLLNDVISLFFLKSVMLEKLLLVSIGESSFFGEGVD